MTYQKVVKSQRMFSHQSVKLSSYTSLSDHCNSIPSSRSVIHSEPLPNVNVHRNFGLKIHGRHGTFDVGDLPVPTFGNWVLKTEWLSGLRNYTCVFLCFLCVFKIQNSWLFAFHFSRSTRFQWQRTTSYLLALPSVQIFMQTTLTPASFPRWRWTPAGESPILRGGLRPRLAAPLTWADKLRTASETIASWTRSSTEARSFHLQRRFISRDYSTSFTVVIITVILAMRQLVAAELNTDWILPGLDCDFGGCDPIF